jgi:uncharacterized membrane protein YkvA (DUF1232 family)
MAYDPEIDSPQDRTPPAPEAAFEDHERHAEDAFARGYEAPVSRGTLLRIYDRLRERILKAVEGKGGRSGKLTEKAIRALLLVPDVFILLVRLALDKEVPGSARAMIGGALAYFILPIDLMPEAILGGAGYLDDLVLAAAVLAQAFGGDLEPYARKHWSGPEDLRVVLRDLTETAESLLGHNVFARLKKILSRRGVSLDDRDRT